MSRQTGPKIGQYRHTAGNLVPGPDGTPRPARTRRRFPYRAMIFMGSGLAGPVACAGVAMLFNTPALHAWTPQPMEPVALPPSPSMNNVLFGAGVHEVALASALAGFCLWTWLWNLKLTPDQKGIGFSGAFAALSRRALVFGPSCTLGIGLPAGCMGIFLRTGPANIPWIARPFFGLIALLPMVLGRIISVTIPVVLILMGMVMGLVMAAGVAAGWQHFPEEADLR
jgi:hypothetical protein